MHATYRDIVNSWLRELEPAGAPLTLDEEGLCPLSYGDDLECLLEVPEHRAWFNLYTPLVPVPAEDPGLLLYQALSLKLFQLGTRGAVIAVDHRSDEIVLCHGQAIEHTDSVTFRNILVNFCETAAKLRRELAGPPVEVASELARADDPLPGYRIIRP